MASAPVGPGRFVVDVTDPLLGVTAMAYDAGEEKVSGTFSGSPPGLSLPCGPLQREWGGP